MFMERILTAAEARQADAETIEGGIPSPVLMERAALSVADVLVQEGLDLSGVLVVCGTGNNGGDGIAVARLLCERGFRPQVLCCGQTEKYSPDRQKQEEILRRFYAADFCSTPEEVRWETRTLLIDALFGIGLSRPVQGTYAAVIRCMNDSGLPIVAVDIPSGIHTDTGQVLGVAVQAAHTVTFTSAKPGLLLYPGRKQAGKLHIRRIGIPVPQACGKAALYRVTQEDKKLLPARDASGNKGTFGKILIIAGSSRICGAAILAGRACLRSGAGMVRIFTEETNRTAIASAFPEALIDTYADGHPDTTALEQALAWADAVLAGPGIGTGETADALLRYLLTHASLPLVLDADAINLLHGQPEMLRSYPAPCVITPHIMELSRLTGKSRQEIQADACGAAREAAARTGVCVVLKDASTVIAQPDGVCRLYGDGSNALATAGSGDVLAGITAALVAGMPEKAALAAAIAVSVHGACGSRAAETCGEAGVIAGDLAAYIRL